MSIKNLIDSIKNEGLLRSMKKLDELYELAINNEQQVAGLQAERDQLAAECAALKKAVPPLKMINADNDSWDDVSIAEEIGFNAAISTILRNLPQTPATDRFLAEQRAQGVDMFAKAASEKAASCVLSIDAGYWKHARDSAQEFAEHLRNEVKV